MSHKSQKANNLINENMNNNFDVIVFDFDNTLFDYAATEDNALQVVFRELNIPYKEKFRFEFIKINRGLWNEKNINMQDLRLIRFKELFKSIGYEIDSDDICKAAAIYIKASEQGILIEGVDETIKELKKRAIILDIASSGFTNPRLEKLHNSSIGGCFDYVLFRENFDHVKIKPDSSFFIEILKNHPDISHNRILYVGDSFDTDIIGSKKTGLSNVWFNFFNTDTKDFNMDYCDFVIYKFCDLLKFI